MFSPPISDNSERAQKVAEQDKLKETIATQKNLVATLQERVDMRTKLVEDKAGAKAAVIDATETLQYQITQEAKQEQDLASLTAGLEVIARNADKAVQDFISDDAEKLDDAERRVEDVAQRLAKAQAQLDHLTLKAPIAGRVQSSIIANVGQVELGLSLGEALRDLLDAPLGVVEFLGVVGDEVLDRLVGIAGDDLEPGGQRSEILLLLRLLGDLILQCFGGVDDGGLCARLLFDELGAHVDALLQGRDEVLLRRDGLLELVLFGDLLRPLGLERGDVRGQLSEIGGENTRFALA